MALILSLESSSEVCSVCLHEDGEILSLVESKEAFSHTRKITVFIQQCLSEGAKDINDVSAIAISGGPGSYTGLRVGASTAKGLCFGLNIPLISIDTLEAIAFHARTEVPDSDYYIPMIDARRMEVYSAVFNREGIKVVETDNVILDENSYTEWFSDKKKTTLCGTGVQKSLHLFEESAFHSMPLDLSAAYLMGLAEKKYLGNEFEDIVSFEPNYFKAPKVTKSKKALF